MSCAVLLEFDSYSKHRDLKNPTKRRIISFAHGVNLILDYSNFGLDQSAIVRSKVMESLLK